MQLVRWLTYTKYGERIIEKKQNALVSLVYTPLMSKTSRSYREENTRLAKAFEGLEIIEKAL